MRRNECPEFVGLEYLKKKHASQIAEFESWAASGEWIQFHHSHYDWLNFRYFRRECSEIFLEES